MIIAVGLAAFAWVWIAAGPFMLIASRWYRAARAAGATPAFTSQVDLLVRTSPPRWPDSTLRVLGPYAWDIDSQRGPLYQTRWTLALVLMVVSWLIGVPAILVIGPRIAGAPTEPAPASVFASLLALSSVLGIGSYAAWRHMGWRVVVRYVVLGALFVGIVAVNWTDAVPAMSPAMCSEAITGVLFFVIGIVGVVSVVVVVYAPPSRWRVGALVFASLGAAALLILGSGCMNARG